MNPSLPGQWEDGPQGHPSQVSRRFVRAVKVTGDLENLGQGTPEDQHDS
jgi:hypothetical protein